MTVDVDDLGFSLLYDPFLVRPIKVYVAVQPERGLVPVDEVNERSEADVGHVLRIARGRKAGSG